MCNIRYAIPVERANFPNEWKQKNPPATSNPSTHSAGYGAGQQRGGDCTSQGAGHLVATLQRNYGMAQRFGDGGFHGQYSSGTPRPFRGSMSTQYVTAILAKTKSILTM